MTEYNRQRLTAYLPAPGVPFERNFHTIAFPPSWREGFVDLYKLGSKHPDKVTSVPIRRLNEVNEATLPNLVSVSKYATRDDDSPWLYSYDEIPMSKLKLAVYAWIRDLLPTASGESPNPAHVQAVNDLCQRLDFTELGPLAMPVDLWALDPAPSHTVQPEPRLFHLLADALAMQVIEYQQSTEQICDLHNTPLTFRIAPAYRGAELVSWPPRPHKDDEGQWWFSYVISISVQTMALGVPYRIHLRTGVRRWAEPGPAAIPFRRTAAAYLLSKQPSSPAGQNLPRFARSLIRHGYTAGSYDWNRGGPAGMLTKLDFDQTIPTPEKLQADPGSFLNGSHTDRFAITHSTMMGSHGVGAGLMAGDRVPLDEWLAAALGQYLVRVPDHLPVSGPSKPANHPTRISITAKDKEKPEIAARKQKQIDEQKARILRRRRLGLARVLSGEPLIAAGYWQNDRTRDAMINELAGVLGVEGPGGTDPNLRTWTTPELNVQLHLRKPGQLAADLTLPAGKTPGGRLRKAISDRRSLIRDHFTQPDAILADICMVEIRHPKTLTRKSSDPKFAIRLGLADTGQLSQFIVLPDPRLGNHNSKNIAQRVAAGWRDAVRQLGVRDTPESDLPRLPSDLHTVALWMIKPRYGTPTGKRQLTLLSVRIAPDGTICGFDSTSGMWLPYRHYLLALTRQAAIPEDDDDEQGAGPDIDGDPDAADDLEDPDVTDLTFQAQRTAAEAFLKAALYNQREIPTLLITHAQNSRGRIPFLTNPRLQSDRIQFGGSAAQAIGVYGKQLRHVRLRDSSMDETPQWYAHNPAYEDKYGIGAHLWQHPDGLSAVAGTTDPLARIFYSTAEKPDTAKRAAVRMSRIAPRKNLKGTEVNDTGIPAWNPSILEILTAGLQSTDYPEDWGMLVHHMRYCSDYRSPLLLPLAMHMAKLAGQYVIPNDPDEDDDPGNSAGLLSG